MFGGTVIIDDCAGGGSDDRAWHLHIAHAPALRLQCPEEFPRAPLGRTENARSAVRFCSLAADGSPDGAAMEPPNFRVGAPSGTGEAQ